MTTSWVNEHTEACPVTRWRADLLSQLEREPDNPGLLGAVPEYDLGGDQEVELCTCRLGLIRTLQAEREEKAEQLQTQPRPVTAGEVQELDEAIARLEAGIPCCRFCGSVRLVAWYPTYDRQGIEVYRDEDGSIRYDYTGEDTDSADDAGDDDEYRCLDCDNSSMDLDYLVGARDEPEITRDDAGAMRELERMLDAREWTSAADYLEDIAAIVRSTGRKVRPPLEDWTTAELTAELERLPKSNLYASPMDRNTRSPATRELAERIEAELAERRLSDSAHLTAMQQGSVPRDIAD